MASHNVLSLRYAGASSRRGAVQPVPNLLSYQKKLASGLNLIEVVDWRWVTFQGIRAVSDRAESLALFVMAGLDPATHVHWAGLDPAISPRAPEIPGSSPGMTKVG